MKLKATYENKDLIPAEHLPLYAERDGAWRLDVDGLVEKARLDEFRASNIALLKERDDLKQKFDGIDPDLVRAGLAEKAALEQREREQAAEAEKRVEQARLAARAELQQQLAALSGERDSLHARLAAIQIDHAVVAVAMQRGLRHAAIPDITARARAALAIIDGAPAVTQPDGKTRRAGRNGPMTLEEWLDAQASEAPHLFEASSGSGAAGSTSGGGRGQAPGKNPFRKETWNLTDQARLQKTDPQEAARLKAAA